MVVSAEESNLKRMMHSETVRSGSGASPGTRGTTSVTSTSGFTSEAKKGCLFLEDGFGSILPTVFRITLVNLAAFPARTATEAQALGPYVEEFLAEPGDSWPMDS